MIVLQRKLITIDSERSDECIDFTMLCVFFFFLCLCTRESVEIMLEFQTLGVVSDFFQKRREKPKKNDGKTGIFTQNQFSTKSIFLYGCNSKTNHCKNMKFSPNVYVNH
ncbi:Uncharacterized protein FWK35_00026184 [Aphis craccivora]|uniref:Uncharacterized protein n=1 Tax=Aphis craccivora TaxID=307492 RepID=A0A6G0Z2E4_APHCR|nr:Uncharacterized protein FWK35_00026184 [Aphis craccivora]